MNITVTGAGGFIGGHLVNRLIEEGNSVVAVDIKPIENWYQCHGESKNFSNYDIAIDNIAEKIFDGSDEVYHLACDMGGMGFLASHRVDCLHSVDITSNAVKYSEKYGVSRFFYASSACVYPDFLQQKEIVSLKESDAWPADPEPAYGLEKLYGEEFCNWYSSETNLITRVARYHNVYGPYGTWEGGREKAPAAICRKVIEAKMSGNHSIDIWGDGEQTRSFMYISDCLDGSRKIMDSENYSEPLNLGSDRLISINDLVTIVETIANISLKRNYNLTAPQGVRGRNSDNTLLEKTINWTPKVGLEDGLEYTYKWIWDEINK